MVGISTDKTAPPVGNIYGYSKAVMERMFCSLDQVSNTKFSCVRFGNIASSTGSVFPIWKSMTESSGIIESTGPEMRRFFFSVDEASNLVLRNMNNIDLFQGKILSQIMKSAQISGKQILGKNNLAPIHGFLPAGHAACTALLRGIL